MQKPKYINIVSYIYILIVICNIYYIYIVYENQSQKYIKRTLYVKTDFISGIQGLNIWKSINVISQIKRIKKEYIKETYNFLNRCNKENLTKFQISQQTGTTRKLL